MYAPSFQPALSLLAHMYYIYYIVVMQRASTTFPLIF
jgi:hypothetical protein